MNKIRIKKGNREKNALKSKIIQNMQLYAK